MSNPIGLRTDIRLRDKSHRPTHRHHKYVPQPQVHHSSDDARQRPQDAKDLHGLHQAILRRNSRRNRRNVQERERHVVKAICGKIENAHQKKGQQPIFFVRKFGGA